MSSKTGLWSEIQNELIFEQIRGHNRLGERVSFQESRFMKVVETDPVLWYAYIKKNNLTQ